ncbi:hypothetical protein [Streptomyces sp. NPDC001422]|uniref:hypothetical protein n=1 Tax=Streptomyces sp. NPDC001422 TaxID=3364575 RepID=UPI0036A1D4CF
MSSNYRVLCLSHDPAIIARDHDYNRPEQAEAAIRDGIQDHEHCDLAIGRYSYPLIELGCPATRDQPAKLRCTHAGTEWTDKDWLLLLAAAYQSTDPDVRQAVQDGYHGCLPWERLQRLRAELGITVKEQPIAEVTPAT